MRNNFVKKFIVVGMITTMSLGTVACGAKVEAGDKSKKEAVVADQAKEDKTKEDKTKENKVDTAVVKEKATQAPKYVFMFIGDGMSHVQTQLANYYLDAVANDPDAEILKSEPRLSFMDFDSVGITTTYDSTSFAPDSASTATSLATGKKTHSGTINMDESFTEKYPAITETVKEELGYKVGVVTSVTLNHATPAAYYAHNESRNNYYDIALEIADSDFDYFAGGALNKPEGADGNQDNIYDVIADAGYTVIVEDQAAAEAVNADTGKVLIVGEDTNGGALPYENDRDKDMWALSDYVAKGIEVLDNETGFFLTVEAGKIDWACHANDATSSIADTIAFSDAIQEAIDFYNEHPEDTLIVVTGDHETGGLTIGSAGTKYDTFLAQLKGQQGSYEAFEAEYVAKYIEEKTPFEKALVDIETYFGLTTEGEGQLVLTPYELEQLKAAYQVSVTGAEVGDEQKAYELYGGYDALSVTLTHILNNKSGVDFTSYSHTGVTVGTYAQGVGSELFDGFYDNIEIYSSLATLLGVE